MRSLFKKSLAFCLVLALALSCFVGAITVNAETYNATISISAESLDSVPVTDTVVPVTLTINSDVAINVARLALSLTGGLRFNANPVVESEEYEITEISDNYSLFFVEAIDGEEDGNTVVVGYTNATVTLSVLVPAFTTPGTYAINVVTSGVNASTPNEEDVNLVYDGSGAILVATDAEVPVIVVNNNPVVVNGSAQGISTANSDLVDTNAPDNFSVAHGNKYVVTYLGGLNATDDTMYDFYMNNSAEQIALNDPYAVNGLSFKLKVNGQLPKFGIYLDDSGSNWYEGEIKAYDAYGTLVATKEANEGWFFNGTLPEDFEGTIIIDNTNYRTENGKITFAQFYNEYGFTGVTLAAAIPHDAVDGDLLMEYDDLRLISDDLDTYVNSLVYCRHLNTTESEEITLAPTCIEAGTKSVTVTCDDCGEVVSATANIEIPRTGAHKYSPDVCSVCGAINPEVPVIPVKGNPVIINGSVQGISERTGNAGTNSPDNFDVAYGEKYVVTYKGGIDASKDAMFDFFLYNGDKNIYLDDPSAVKGLSFKLKVNGKLPKFGMYHDDNGTCYYRGEIWAYDTTGTLVATKPNGDPFIFKNTLPEDFEGTIVIGVDNNKIAGGSGTFADHYAQHGLRGLKLAAAIPHDAADGDFFMEYDDLRLITDDLDTYKASLATPADCEHSNTTLSGVETLAPTCIEAGTKTVTVTCDDCGEVISVTENMVIPSTGEHNYVDGSCDMCGAVEPDECKHPNTTVSEEITKPATCIEVGTKTVTVTCDDCGVVVSVTENVEVPSTGEHYYEDGACTGCGASDPNYLIVENNPVIIDGSIQGISERTGNAGTNSPDNFDVAYGEKYVVTYKGGIDASKDAMFDFFLYYGNKKLTLDNPSAVKGLSFKLKVNGKLPKFGMYHDDNGTCYYRGEIWAYDTQGNLVATKPNGDPFIFKNTLPEDFEGTIVIGVDNNKIHGGSGTFADHYAQHGLRGLKLAAAIPHDAVAGDFFMEYDDLRLITDDLDTYKASLAAPAACEHANKSADWIIETVPTATTVGSKHKLCADCGEKVDVTEMPTTETEYVAFSNQRYNPAIEGIELIYSYGNDSDFRAILRHANSTKTRKLAYVIKIGEKEYDFKMDTIGSGRQIITGGFSLQDISSDVALFIRVTWTEDGVEKVFESNPYVDRYDELLEENIAAGAFSADELEVVNAYKALVTAANAATTAMDVTTVNAESGYITYSAAKYTASLSSIGFVYDYSASSFKADVLDVAKATGTRNMYYIIDINGKEYDFEMQSIGSGRQIITGGLSVSDLANAKFFIRITWTDPVEGAKVVDTNAVSINAAADLAAADTALADAYNAYIAAIS